MAFGGAPVNLTTPPLNQSAPSLTLRIQGLTLAAFVAAPAAPANADTGVLTTGTPVANQTQLLATFGGKVAGGWVAGDENCVHVVPEATSDATQGAGGQLPSPHVAESAGIAVVAGNLVVTIHNRGLQACAAMELDLCYQHPIIR